MSGNASDLGTVASPLLLSQRRRLVFRQLPPDLSRTAFLNSLSQHVPQMSLTAATGGCWALLHYRPGVTTSLEERSSFALVEATTDAIATKLAAVWDSMSWPSPPPPPSSSSSSQSTSAVGAKIVRRAADATSTSLNTAAALGATNTMARTVSVEFSPHQPGLQSLSPFPASSEQSMPKTTERNTDPWASFLATSTMYQTFVQTGKLQGLESDNTAAGGDDGDATKGVTNLVRHLIRSSDERRKRNDVMVVRARALAARTTAADTTQPKKRRIERREKKESSSGRSRGGGRAEKERAKEGKTAAAHQDPNNRIRILPRAAGGKGDKPTTSEDTRKKGGVEAERDRKRKQKGAKPASDARGSAAPQVEGDAAHGKRSSRGERRRRSDEERAAKNNKKRSDEVSHEDGEGKSKRKHRGGRREREKRERRLEREQQAPSKVAVASATSSVPSPSKTAPPSKRASRNRREVNASRGDIHAPPPSTAAATSLSSSSVSGARPDKDRPDNAAMPSRRDRQAATLKRANEERLRNQSKVTGSEPSAVENDASPTQKKKNVFSVQSTRRGNESSSAAPPSN